MKKMIFAALCVAGSATSANAAVTVSQVAGSSTYAGPTPTYTFSVGSRPAIVGGKFYDSSISSAAMPLGGSGSFYAVDAADQTGTISLAGFGAISSLSFIWGSVDSYNTLSFLNAAGQTIYSLTGTQLMGGSGGANGSQTTSSTNPVVTFSFTGSDQSVSALRLSSSADSFEIDNLAISPVPEPATWGMMLLGLGLAGASLRRRRATAVRTVAA